ncbi:MAG: alpha-glucuronidase family glycosyl hydrolase, partial [bacterium]
MTSSRREFVATTSDGLHAAGALPPARPDEDGYRLWLRYAPLETVLATPYRAQLRGIFVDGTSATAAAVRRELVSGLTSMLGVDVPAGGTRLTEGALVVGTPATSARIRTLGWTDELDRLGPEGFVIRNARVEGRPALVVASTGDVGAMYGAFHLLRLVQTARPLARVDVVERPKLQLRLLNHWDNLDGTIERGYAGGSLWQWADL